MTSSALAPGGSRRADPSFCIATASIFTYFVLLTVFNNHPVADEGLHLLAVERLIGGDWRHPDFLPMPLSYHFLVYWPAKVLGVEVWVLRLVSAVFSIALLWIVRSINRVQTCRRGSRLLHFAWLPILFPFTGLAYTEIVSLLLLLTGVLLHLRKRTAWSAVPLAGACLVRQSNIVWVAFVTAWGALEVWQRGRREPHAEARTGNRRQIKAIVSHVWPQLVILLAAAEFFLLNQGFNITAVEANRFRFNSTQLCLFALHFAVLWGPIWLPSLGADLIAMGRWIGRRPMLGGATILLSLVIAVGATATYWNPHPWNHNLNFLRNWPLVLMERSLIWRGLAALLVLLALPGLVRRTSQAPNRPILLLTWGFSLAYVALHSLVDPRYYIPPLVLLQFFAGFRDDEARQLTIWYGVVSAAASGYVIVAGHRLGGLW